MPTDTFDQGYSLPDPWETKGWKAALKELLWIVVAGALIGGAIGGGVGIALDFFR